MEHCRTCGESLEPGELCPVCLLAGGIEHQAELPETIGRYRILRLLGEGGMGAVFEAEQEQPRRTVALKVIRSGLAQPDLLRRFEKESQALARLHHPGIAQVYEAGAADQGFGPQPYFAMEFIQGQALDQYAEAKKLTTRQRLQLMIQICEAVQHAHERGIIHRDLKPSNILVEESGQPKILDFGVARMTDADTQATRQTDLGQLIGTVAYMSPEQVTGDPLEIDTRSDIYTLGMILYQLLAGRLPYMVTRHLPQALQMIREQEPSPLSSINRIYRGDIETIASKALEKEKSRRYASAADLAQDLRRYLEHLPIAARPPGAAYQLGKFARRHRTLVGGVAGVFATLVAGLVASTMEANRARTAERSAIAARQSAVAAQEGAVMERDRAVAAEQRAETARSAAERATQRATASEAQARVERDRAIEQKGRADRETAVAQAVNDFLQKDVLEQTNNRIQAGPKSKPDPDIKIRTALDRAAARIDGKFGGQPLVEASIRETIGQSYRDLGLFQEAERHLARALELRKSQLGTDNPQTAMSMKFLADVFLEEGKYTEAETVLSETLAIQRRVLGEESGAALATARDLAITYQRVGKDAEAAKLMKQVLEEQRRVMGENSAEVLLTTGGLGSLYNKLHKYAESAEMLSGLDKILRKRFGDENPNTIANAGNLANAYVGLHDYAQAEELLVQSRAVQLRVRGEKHPNTLLTFSSLANVYAAEGKRDLAEAAYKQLVEMAPQAFGPQHPTTLLFIRNLAHLYAEEGRNAEAEPLLAKVLDARKRVLGPQHPETIAVMSELAFTRIELQKYADAEPVIRESMSAHAKLAPDSNARLIDSLLLGASLAGQKKYAEADPLLVNGYQGLRQHPSEGHEFYLQKARGWIAQLYRDWGKPAEATEWLRTDGTKIANSSR